MPTVGIVQSSGFCQTLPKNIWRLCWFIERAGPFEVANGNLWIFASCKFHVFPNFFVWDHQFPIERISRIESGHCRGIYTYTYRHMEGAKWDSHGIICIFMNIGDIPWSLVRLAHCDLDCFRCGPIRHWKEPLTPWPLDSTTFNFPGISLPEKRTSKFTPWKNDGLERCNNVLLIGNGPPFSGAMSMLVSGRVCHWWIVFWSNPVEVPGSFCRTFPVIGAYFLLAQLMAAVLRQLSKARAEMERGQQRFSGKHVWLCFLNLLLDFGFAEASWNLYLWKQPAY